MLLPNRPMPERLLSCREEGADLRLRMLRRAMREGLTSDEMEQLMDATREGLREIEDGRQTYTYADVYARRHPSVCG